MTEDPRRRLPGVDRLLARPEVERWIERWGRRPVTRAVREVLDEVRDAASGVDAPFPDEAALAAAAGARLKRWSVPSLRSVLNATGVVLHTNLGRAPLAREAQDAMRMAAGYGNVEFDLDEGRRGSRYDHCGELLRELSGGEAALAVNNNAAAVSLAVNTLAAGRDVLVSRGELVEIGGSFRMPDVVRRSGGRLAEVGTTNRTRVADYREAAGPETGLLLKVHPSNYRVEGFVEDAPLAALVELGAALGVPVAFDLGSGLLEAGLLPGFPAEPTVRAAVEAGADVVTFSGDKLLGGPQAGLMVGRAPVLARMRRNPLLRAFRVDKTTLAALEATLRLHRDPAVACRRVPALRALTEEVDAVERRARDALRAAELPAGLSVEVRATEALVGGGAFPGHRVASAGWHVADVPAAELDAACRRGEPPLVGRVAEGALWLDFRTVPPGEESAVAGALASAAERVLG